MAHLYPHTISCIVRNNVCLNSFVFADRLFLNISQPFSRQHLNILIILKGNYDNVYVAKRRVFDIEKIAKLFTFSVVLLISNFRKVLLFLRFPCHKWAASY